MFRGAFVKVEPSEPASPASAHAHARVDRVVAVDSVMTPATPAIDSPDGDAGASWWLRRAAGRWPSRTGARWLQQHARPGYYEGLVASWGQAVHAEEQELVQLDVERSHVDGLEEYYPAWLTEETLQAALTRLLMCWCSRHPDGYCQGINFPAKVLLVVLYHGADGNIPDEEAPSSAATPDERALSQSEELAFWTFTAMMELILPRDFYAAPDMPGLQVDARGLFELFLCSRLGARRSTDTEWRDILRLCAYKWFVPCYVNAVSLPTLLVYWDTLFLRRPPTGQEGLSAAHLMLALALVSATLDETRDEMADSRPEECLAHGFNRLLSGALAQVDAEALVATAARFEVSTRQLAYLRVHLAGPAVHMARQRADSGEGSDVMGMGAPPPPPLEPSLNALHVVAFWLMRQPKRLPLRVLKHTLLLQQPPPPPATPATRILPGQALFPALVSMCAIFFTACCLAWTAYLPAAKPRDVIKVVVGRRLLQMRSWRPPDLIP